jgi:hypothetical protein
MCNVSLFNKREMLFKCILVVLLVSMILLNNHCVFYVHVTMHRNKFLYNKTN